MSDRNLKRFMLLTRKPKDPPKPKKITQVETDIKRGDIFQLGSHRLMCGDSTRHQDVSQLMNGQLADLIVTDPPYNVNYKSEAGSGYAEGKYAHKKAFSDNKSLTGYHHFLTLTIENIYNFSKEKAPVYFWHPTTYVDLVVGTFRSYNYSLQTMIIWLKDNIVFGHSTYHKCYETAAYCWKNGHRPYENKAATAKERNVWMDKATFMDYINVWYVQRDLTVDYEHPTQKPIALAERSIRNSSREKDRVLDLFGGSGWCLLACERLERKCYMMEIDPHYCQVIIDRWESYTGLKAEKLE